MWATSNSPEYTGGTDLVNEIISTQKDEFCAIARGLPREVGNKEGGRPKYDPLSPGDSSACAHNRDQRRKWIMVRPKRIGGRAMLPGLLITVLVLACMPRPVAAQEFPTLDKKTAEEVLPKKPYSPYVGQT